MRMREECFSLGFQMTAKERGRVKSKDIREV
jgi:hypothetical protein